MFKFRGWDLLITNVIWTLEAELFEVRLKANTGLCPDRVLTAAGGTFATHLLMFSNKFLAEGLLALQAVHRCVDEIKADHARQAFVLVEVGVRHILHFQMVA